MKAVLVVLLIAAGAFGFLFARERSALKEAQAELEQVRAEKETIAQGSADAPNLEGKSSGAQKTEGGNSESRVTPAEIERMKADQREAIRLRGEVASLKREVADAKANAAREESVKEKVKRFQEQKREALEQAGASATFTPGQVFSEQASTTLPAGKTLVLGGWETEPGKKTYALFTPTITENGTNSLTIDAKWISVPSELAEKYASLFPTGQEPIGSDKVAELVKTLNDTGQMQFLTAPRLTTLSGQRGRISAGGEFGPRVDFQPTLAPDGSIQINLDAKATAHAAPQPQTK